MKYVKILGLAAVAAMAMMAVAASSASATTLEVNGVTQNGPVTITASLEDEGSATLKTTSSSFVDTCTTSHVHGTTTSPYSASVISGHIEELTFDNCTHETEVHKAGSLSVEWTSGTNGTVRSTGAEVTVESTTFGVTLTCKTNNTDIGKITGVSSGHATMDIDGVVNCGFFVPSAKWEGSYWITSPTGLGVEA